MELVWLVEKLRNCSIGWRGMGLFVPLVGNDRAPLTARGNVSVPAAGGTTERAPYRFARAGVPIFTVTLNVTELWPPDTSSIPGANTIIRIRKIPQRGQKDKDGLGRKWRSGREWKFVSLRTTERTCVRCVCSCDRESGEQVLKKEVMISQVSV